MNAVASVFSKPRVFLPVIHACNIRQVEKSFVQAVEGGADGVFLINQGGMAPPKILEVILGLRKGRHEFFYGVNFLGMDPLHVAAHLKAYPEIQGLWADNAGVNLTDLETTEKQHKAFQGINWGGLYFGGTAFKYQREVPLANVKETARLASISGVNVVTTSGPGTGQPPTAEKLRLMREGLGPDHALAVASGITPENVGEFVPYADAFLVATGIEESFGHFDPDRLKALADAIHGYKPSA